MYRECAEIAARPLSAADHAHGRTPLIDIALPSAHATGVVRAVKRGLPEGKNIGVHACDKCWAFLSLFGAYDVPSIEMILDGQNDRRKHPIDIPQHHPSGDLQP